MKSDEKIFRQMKQNFARVVLPTRRDFVKYHEKDFVDFPCDEFLEIPLILISDKNLKQKTFLLYQWGRGPMGVTESYRTSE